MRGGPGNPDAFRGVLNRFRGQNRGGFRGPPGPPGPRMGGPGSRFMGPDNFRGGDRGRGGFDGGRVGRGRPMGGGRGRMR